MRKVGLRRLRNGAIVGLSLGVLTALVFVFIDLVDMRGWNLFGGLAVAVSAAGAIGLAAAYVGARK